MTPTIHTYSNAILYIYVKHTIFDVSMSVKIVYLSFQGLCIQVKLQDLLPVHSGLKILTDHLK